MANLKISELTPLGVAPNPNDIIPLTDVDVGVTRSVKISELQAAVQALASNLTDISPIVQANGTMIASNGTNFVSLNTLLPAGLTKIRADLGLGTAALLNSGPSDGNLVVLDATGLPAVDGSQLTGISSAVEGTEVLSTGEGGGTKFLREDGDNSSSWQPLVVGDEQLRGTANPHIGAFPNQSLKVLDSQPSGSALMVADATGLKFAVGASANVYVVKGASASPSRLAEASELPSFIITKDSGEPDIELTDADGEVYSVVNGDLISGGTIS